MALRKRKRSPILLVSVAVHLGLAAGIAFIPQQKLREVVAIALAETARPVEPKPAPLPKEASKPARPSRTINAASRLRVGPALSQVAQPGVASFKDIGVALDASALDGLAVPMTVTEKKPAPTIALAVRKPKVLMSKRLEEVCDEEISRPVPDLVVRPDYTDSAREARVEGRVRVEVLVDESGNVSTARVLKGLGYGLDEAALAAVKKMRFRPGTRCAKPVVAPFVMAVRFLLGT